MAHSHSEEHEEFSLPLFTLTVLVTLTGLLAALRWLAPGIWDAQFLAPIWKGAVAFAVMSLVNCFVEYFFHRYVLHTPAISFLRRLYKQHTLHHALTRIARKSGRDGQGILFIENKFPIIEAEQGEASFFPWYSLTVFSALQVPGLALLQWLFPAFPWFFAGFFALASSLTLYEVLHAINHWPFEKWEPLITHRFWGRFWMPAYAFHLRHHAVIDCNESISGFFGLPVGDWAFRTCVIPQTVYADGEEWTPDKFRSPRPRWLIRQLDGWANRVVAERRLRASASPSEKENCAVSAAGRPQPRPYTRGEEIANWVTHGIGLIASIVGLTLLIVYSSLRGSAWHVVSFTVFGLTLLILYTVSTLYHTQRRGRAKRFFLKLDYAAAFLLIAGTYTPFLLTSLRGPWGWSLFGVIWGVCGAGAIFQLLIARDRHRFTSTLAYCFVGWLIVVAMQPVLKSVPEGGLWLLLAGVLCYTLGVVFYQWRQLRYHHAVWHTFVLGGSACHYLAVLLFLLPQTGGAAQ